jgi:hypothetical protein
MDERIVLLRKALEKSATANPTPLAVERCACRGHIVAESYEATEIRDAVLLHNLTPRHLEWRATGGLQARDDPELFGRVAA